MRTRTFLEPAKTNIDSYVAVDIGDDEQRSLKIADCNHGVTLDFGTGKWDDRSRGQALAKLDKLQKAINKIGTSIEKAADQS